MANPVGWFEIYVNNIERARMFYQTVLGIHLERLADPVDSEITMFCFPSEQTLYGATGALVQMSGMAGGGSSTVVYFSCDNCAEQQGRVQTAGGRVIRPKFAIGEHGFIALIEDSEGNMVGLHSMQ